MSKHYFAINERTQVQLGNMLMQQEPRGNDELAAALLWYTEAVS